MHVGGHDDPEKLTTTIVQALEQSARGREE